jgi:drug/metabolite transporter (DMT)-like permease
MAEDNAVARRELDAGNRKVIDWVLIASLGAMYIIWGTTYLGIRFAIATLPPLLMAGTRFLVAGSLLYAWGRMRGGLRPKALEWRGALVTGALLLLGGNGLVTWAETRVPSNIAALLVSTTPFWMVMLDWKWKGGRRPDGRLVGGLVLGFAGVALMVAPGAGQTAPVHPLGALALVGASVSWAVGSLMRRTAPAPQSPSVATGMEMLAGGALMTVAGLALGEGTTVNLAGVSAQSLGAYLYLIVFGSVIAFSAYMYVLRHTTVAVATSHSYVNPVVAVFAGWMLAGEILTPRAMVAACVIVGAVALLTLASHREASPEAG